MHEPRTAVKELTDHELLTVLRYSDEDHAEAGARSLRPSANRRKLRSAIEIIDWQPRQGQRSTLQEEWFSLESGEALVSERLGYMKRDVDSQEPILRTSERVVKIYNSRLAEIVASRGRFQPDRRGPCPFPGSANWGPEIVRDVLLNGSFDGPVTLIRPPARLDWHWCQSGQHCPLSCRPCSPT